MKVIHLPISKKQAKWDFLILIMVMFNSIIIYIALSNESGFLVSLVFNIIFLIPLTELMDSSDTVKGKVILKIGDKALAWKSKRDKNYKPVK